MQPEEDRQGQKHRKEQEPQEAAHSEGQTMFCFPKFLPRALQPSPSREEDHAARKEQEASHRHENGKKNRRAAAKQADAIGCHEEHKLDHKAAKPGPGKPQGGARPQTGVRTQISVWPQGGAGLLTTEHPCRRAGGKRNEQDI